MSEIVHIPCRLVVPGQNDRTDFDQARLVELADSIRQNSLAQPITVRQVAAGFEIVAGERRFRAISQILSWPTVPAIVRSLTDEEASAIMLAENTSRADLNPIEEALAYQARISRFGWDIETIAARAGKSADLVRRRLSLLKLASEIQSLLRSGHLPIGHAEAMTVLDTNRQRLAIRIYNQGGAVTLSQFRHIVGELHAEQSQESLFDLASFWVEQVQQENFPRRGAHAFTGAPTRPDLPPVVMASSSDSVSAVIDRYIATLLDQGRTQEAAVIGTLYDSLVRLNFLTVPPGALLPGRS